MAFTPRSSLTTIPPPPRSTGEPESDSRALVEWTNNFYSATVVESGLLDPEYQASGGDDVDLDNLPDPANTTIARAQQTANEAVALASARFGGSFTVSELETGVSVDFEEALASTDYVLVASCRAFTGSPASGAFSTAAITKGTGGFAATLAAAPGGGASVTFDYVVIAQGA